ncbi:MAG: ABC transporter ATP-binding protein [Acidilobaceae archaeon]
MSLRVESLSAGYGKLQILFDISFGAKRGEIVAIVGPNGSGKSTLLKAIFGLASVYSGRVVFEEIDVTRVPPHEKARLGLAYLPQTDNVFLNLSVEENLKIAAYGLREEEARERIERVLEFFPFLKKRMEQKASSLSGGERQMLGLAMVLIREPKLIMLDEPTAGVAPSIAKWMASHISRLRDEFGKTVLLVEQNARLALSIADTALLLVSGRVAYFGDAVTLARDPELGSKYVGLSP